MGRARARRKSAWIELNWWWVTEQTYLRSQAVRDNDPRTWESLHKHAIKRRAFRGGRRSLSRPPCIALLISCGLAFAPWWASALAALAVLPVLAWFGRPDDKPILTSATVPVAYETLSFEVVVRALEGLRIGRHQPGTAPRTARAPSCSSTRSPADGPGWLARLDLPHGVTAGEVSERREPLAIGLRRQLGVRVARDDPQAASWCARAVRRRRGHDDRRPARLAAAQARHGRRVRPGGVRHRPARPPVTITLMFASIIIGSVPRMGKTFLLRLLLLICALDLRVRDPRLRLQGNRATSSPSPRSRTATGQATSPEDIEYLVADMRAMRTEMRRRTKVIREHGRDGRDALPGEQGHARARQQTRASACTRSLSAWDECQIPFEHPEYGKELIAIATDLTKRGPALGIMLMLATQRPDAKSIPTGISANAMLRMCLKVMGQVENDMVLGTSMYKNGIRATMFARDDKGVFYFAGEGLNPVIMRGYGFDLPASKVIGARARTMREAAGRLTGYALGEDADVEVRSIAEDVLLVFRDDTKLYLATIAARLAESIPAAYADITPEAVRASYATSARTPSGSASPAGCLWPGTSGAPSSPCSGAPMRSPGGFDPGVLFRLPAYPPLTSGGAAAVVLARFRRFPEQCRSGAFRNRSGVFRQNGKPQVGTVFRCRNTFRRGPR